MKHQAAWIWAILAVLLTAGLVLSVACGDDDDDDDDDEEDDDDTEDDDDWTDDDDDTTDDDVTDDDTADDDVTDDDDDATEITDFVLAFTNAKLKLDATIEAEQSFISVGGSINITQIGQTTGSAIEASIDDVEFTEAEIDWSTGMVGILPDGDTGFIGLSEINSTIVAAKKENGTESFSDGYAKGKGTEVFNIDIFTPCEGATCNVAIYAKAFNVYSVNQFTNGYIGVTNDYILMWQFSGDVLPGDTIDLTIDLK